MRLIIQTPLITLNDYINLERGNRYAAAAKKKALTNNVAWEARSQTKERVRGLSDIRIYWLTTGRHDPDNIYFGVKFLLDGLVVAGVLENDNPSCVRNISHYYRKYKENKVIIRIGKVTK